MREIKFRVWQLDSKTFVDLTNDFHKWELSLNSGSVNFSQNCFDGEFGSQNVILQQFTGLKDINNKEIYEGDIVTTRHYDDWHDTTGFDVIQQVKWCDIHVGWRGFTKRMLSDGKKHAGNGLPSPITVIGNIFENPELLKT